MSCPVLVERSLPVSFPISRKSDTLSKKEGGDHLKPDTETLRKKYMANPPEGMTSEDIRYMSEDDLLDMDFFLNDDDLDDDFGEEGFYIL